jgi:hypothetical protein
MGVGSWQRLVPITEIEQRDGPINMWSTEEKKLARFHSDY